MSHTQSKAEKSENHQRKSGRSGNSGHQREFASAGGGGGKGGGGSYGPSAPSSTLAPSNQPNQPLTSSNRSFKKSGNVHGGQHRMAPARASAEMGGAHPAQSYRPVQNSAHSGPPSHGAPAANGPPVVEPLAAQIPQDLPKAPSSQSSKGAPDSANPATTPTKGSANGSFTLQFGSISPGFVDRLQPQFPARTSSAPPNLDEQKRDQAAREASKKAAESQKEQQQPPKNDVAGPIQPRQGNSHVQQQTKRDNLVQIPPVSSVPLPKPSNPPPMPGMSVPMYQQSAPPQFGGLNPQMHSQNIAPRPMQIPMVQVPMAHTHQMYVPGMQPHAMHQGHGLNFLGPMGHQMPPQLGMGMGAQYAPPQANFGSARRPAVKITHPETREELKLDKPMALQMDPGRRPHPNAQPHSQQIPSHHGRFYPPNSYAPVSIYSSTPSGPTISQPMRFNQPVTSQSVSHVTITNPSVPNSMTSSKSGPSIRSTSEPSNLVKPHSTTKAVITSKDETRKVPSLPVEAPPVHKHSGSETVLVSSVNDKKSTPEPPSAVVPVSASPLGESSCVGPGLAGSSTLTTEKEVIQRSDSTNDKLDKSSKEDKQQSLQQTKVEQKSSCSESQGKEHGKTSEVQASEQKTDTEEKPNKVVTTSLKLDGSTKLGIEAEKETAEVHVPEKNQAPDPSADNAKQSGDSQVETSSLRKVSHESVDTDKEHGTGSQGMADQGSIFTGVTKVISKSGDPAHQEPEGHSHDVPNTDSVVSPREKESSHDAKSANGVQEAEARPKSAGSKHEGSAGISVSKPTSETTAAKTAAGVKKKKKKDILSKADAAGTNSDLYMAYKGPAEKSDTISTSENASSSTLTPSQTPEITAENEEVANKEDKYSKSELEDWEDAADMSSPKLKRVESLKKGREDSIPGAEGATMKYSRDFLLTFCEHCVDRPADFELGSDTAAALISPQVAVLPNNARILDRPSSSSRHDRHGALDDDKWMRSNSFPHVRDVRADVHGLGNNAVPRNRGPSGQFTGRTLSGQMQLPGAQGGFPRSNIDADRWQRSPGRGLIPSPHPPGPGQIMHKAEKKYEVGRSSDEEDAKQRLLKSILNKLTPQNFQKLFEQVKEVNIDNVVTLNGVISQIFDKALMEPTFCEMYADFCLHLSSALPDLSKQNEKITFRRLLLNKCQEEFERGEREEAEAGRAEEEGEVKQTPGQREEKRLKARRRMLGNIRLIGELYKKRMLTERIMHECIKKLLGQDQNPDEEDIEALCKLMSTIGEMIDHPKAKEHMDAYFVMMRELSTNQSLSSRVRFLLRDSIDLRKNKWQQRRKVEGPKKIDEVHRDAHQERQAQTSRAGRGPGIISSSRRGPPPDYGRSPLLSPSSQQMGSLRGNRGLGKQDARMEDKHPMEKRTLPVTLQHGPIHDNTITLGPQGGLGKGMSLRGQPLMPNTPIADNSHRVVSTSTWTNNNPSREEMMSRSTSDRYSGRPHDRSRSRDRSPYGGQRDPERADYGSDRSRPNTPSTDRLQGPSAGNSNGTQGVLSEEHLKEKSKNAIREYYSAKDEKEMILCIQELNCPSFYPSMVSLWVTDSFERKDPERELLTKLLINLAKPENHVLSQNQLIQGFESVLSGLEDAVNDAPRATEFLGRIFGNIMLEDLISLNEIGRLICEGGEEPGCLLEGGYAGDVLASILEVVKAKEGDAGVSRIKSSSNLRLEDFRPSRKLEAFL